MECANATKMYPRNTPNKDCFRNYAENLGLSVKDHLILYDRFEFGSLAAPRAWWIFRVKLIFIKFILFLLFKSKLNFNLLISFMAMMPL